MRLCGPLFEKKTWWLTILSSGPYIIYILGGWVALLVGIPLNPCDDWIPTSVFAIQLDRYLML